jgi:hypothetical protein
LGLIAVRRLELTSVLAVLEHPFIILFVNILGEYAGFHTHLL